MPPSKPRRLSLRAKLIWGANLALGAWLLRHSMSGHANNPSTSAPRRVENVPIEQRTTIRPSLPPEMTLRSKPIIELPREPLHFEATRKGSMCSRYAYLAAGKIFKLAYVGADAWDLAQENKSVWHTQKANDTSYLSKLKPGQIIGVLNPGSNYEDRGEYTHVVLYLGQPKGKHMVMHQWGKKDVIESIDQLLAREKGIRIIELIEPKGGL